jgi:hypothetical protein
MKDSQQDTVKKVSPDGGKTWGPMLSMTAANSAARDGIPNIVALDDRGRNLMVVYELNRDTPQLKIWAPRCEDRGAPLYLRLAGVRRLLLCDVQGLRSGLRALRASYL